jgi:hypothetical protein
VFRLVAFSMITTDKDSGTFSGCRLSLSVKLVFVQSNLLFL